MKCSTFFISSVKPSIAMDKALKDALKCTIAQQQEYFALLEVGGCTVKESNLQLLYALVYGSLISSQERLQHATVQVCGSPGLWVPKV